MTKKMFSVLFMLAFTVAAACESAHDDNLLVDPIGTEQGLPSNGPVPIAGDITKSDIRSIQAKLIFDSNHLLTLAETAKEELTPLQYDFALHVIERSNWLVEHSNWSYAKEPSGAMYTEDSSIPYSLIWCGDVASSVSWINRDGAWSDSITPTSCGAWGATGFNNWDAWVEVVAKTPAHSAWNRSYGTSTYWSMYDQFVCHLYFVQGWKTPWNLEPSRPNVGLAATVAAGCNP